MQDAADSVIGLYRRHAAAWARDRGDRLYEGAWLDRFLAIAGPGATVLDIGCGAGQPLAKALTGLGCTVTGVDSSPEMIALCRARFPAGDWHIADMRGLALNRTFNGLLAWDSFFHLSPEHQRAMFPIFRAHAAPGAALMFTSGPSNGVAMGTYAGEPLYHASLAPTEYRALLRANGFAVKDHVIEDPTCGHRTIWLAQSQREFDMV